MASAMASRSMLALARSTPSPSAYAVSSPNAAATNAVVVVASTAAAAAAPSLRAVGFSYAAAFGSGISWAIKRPVLRGATRKVQDVVSCSLKKLEDVELTDLNNNPSSLPAAPGIYAVYDKAGDLQYIGLSRRMSASLQSHMRELPELCASAKFAVVDAPERAALTEAWKSWMEEHINQGGNVPPGNVSGNTTWTARKSRAAKPEVKLTPGANVKLNVPIQTLLDKLVKEIKVVAFIKGTRTSPQCGFSHRVLTILNEQGVDYEVLNVLDEDHNPGLREAIKTYSQWPTIPQLYVKGEFVGGADVLDEMVLSGEIKELFKN